MFEELVRQARRLFSSKSNGGKQVPRLTDRLHTYKQVLVALSIVLLLGYSQFRDHFRCRGHGDLDWRTTTDFCLINGTNTVIERPPGSADEPIAAGPHTGLSFPNGAQRVISHNYMRSYWLLLILLAILSHLAQRQWAALFQNDVLKALLQLAGSDELRQVRAANSAKAYEMLASISSDLGLELKKRIGESPAAGELPRSERVSRRVELVDEFVTIYDQTLEYYPNQLTYLLLTRNPASYKLSCLKLRRNLLLHSLISTALTAAQFFLPLVFLGTDYLFYGWRYACALVGYLGKQLLGDAETRLDNSIDYELSSVLFPTNSYCLYKQFGMTGPTEDVSIQCVIPINEICSKVFVAIWWAVLVSLAFELWSLLSLALCSLSFRTISLTFGMRFWPAAREQADLIATFRHQRFVLQNRSRLIRRTRQAPKLNSKALLVSNAISGLAPPKGDQAVGEKKLDPDLSYAFEGGARQRGQSAKRWYMWSPRDICEGLVALLVKVICCCTSKRREHLEREPEKDINVYYLLYLIYLRLGRSRSKAEEVIRMTASALANYLADLETDCEGLKEGNEELEEGDDEADDYNSLDKVEHILNIS